ncbi:MAG TPA: hypothetical protein VGH28_14750 [Polyangiaceae bacterium]|jgi:hypothetical protein
MAGRAWLGVAFLLGCGARTGIAGEPDFLDASLDVAAVDAKVDATKDAIVSDAVIDAPPAPLCCDEGLKLSGCQSCAAGEQCWNKAGTCERATQRCGPSNCDGCCLSDTLCADGREVGACGTHGQACQTCIKPGSTSYGTCVPDATGGTCGGGDTCTKSNCFHGCCDGNTCMIGDQDTLCGSGGTACVDCVALGGLCKADACDIPHQ